MGVWEYGWGLKQFVSGYFSVFFSFKVHPCSNHLLYNSTRLAGAMEELQKQRESDDARWVLAEFCHMTVLAPREAS